MKIPDYKWKENNATYNPQVIIQAKQKGLDAFGKSIILRNKMIKKHQSHNGHKHQEYNTGKKHPFYQTGKIGFFFHQKSLSER